MPSFRNSEVASRADFSIIRYALCWEDADILLEALQVAPDDVCLSIASAGDNTLSLLSQGPRRVVAIDLSPAQIACLELRVAAFRHLTHGEILALVAGYSDGDRLALYNRVRGDLSEAARNIWDSQKPALSRGVWAAGRFEKYVRLFGRFVLPLIHDRATIDAAFVPRSQQDRQAFFDTIWNTRRWRFLVRLFTSRIVSSWLGRDPSFFRYAEGDVAARTLERGHVALVDLDPSCNPYLHWIVFGRYGDCLPHWLRPENFEPIRRNLDRLEIRAVSLESFLAGADERSVHKFNLSDVFEYISKENADACFAELARVGRRNGRLAYWNTFVPRHRPEPLGGRIRPLEALANRLHAQDKAFFYSAFVVEEIL